jgi:hypothetical protein
MESVISLGTTRLPLILQGLSAAVSVVSELSVPDKVPDASVDEIPVKTLNTAAENIFIDVRMESPIWDSINM